MESFISQPHGSWDDLYDATGVPTTPHAPITTGTVGWSSASPPPTPATSSIMSSTSHPSTTSPNTTCFPLSLSSFPNVMKNCDVLEFLPWLPMHSKPRRSIFFLRPAGSSLKVPFAPWMPSPPVPFPNRMSPPTISCYHDRVLEGSRR